MHNLNRPGDGFTALSPVVVGRARELEVIERALDTAAGTGHNLILAGEAGVGKSRLLAEVRQRAADRFLVLQGNCFEQDSAFPYAVVIDLLRAFLAQRTADEIREAFGALSSEFVKLLPELTWSLPEVQPTPPLDAEAEKRRLFEALARWMNGLAQSRSLLLIFEDLHWSDATSLDFLHFFLRRSVASSIVVVMTYRREEMPATFTRWLAQIDREHLAREIVLNPLTRDQVELMLRAIFASDQPVRAEILDPIVQLTEGNPFFIEEILKDLLESGRLLGTAASSEAQIPRSIAEAVQRRVARLSEAARSVIVLAAVAGRRFDFELLQSLTNYDEAILLGVMKELIAAQLVSEETSGRFVFRHALTQHAIYGQALVLERTHWHRRVGEVLERRQAAALETELNDLAYHFERAEAWDKTLLYAQRAGEKAQLLYAPHAAIEQLTRALKAVQQLKLTPAPAIYHARGQAHELCGDFEAARLDFEQARQISRTLNDRAAEWQSLIDLGFLWAARDYTQTGDYFQQALAVVRTLQQPALLGQTLNRLGNWCANTERCTEAVRHHREAQDIFEELNDRGGLAQTLDLLGLACFVGGDLIEASACYQRAIDLFRELDDRAGLSSALATFGERGTNFLTDLLMTPDVTVAQTITEEEEAVRLAREIGWRAGEAYALCTLASCQSSAGQFASALDAVHQAVQITEEIDHRQWASLAQLVLGGVHAALLAFADARPCMERAVTLAHEVGSAHFIGAAHAALALICVQLNDLPRAAAVLAEVLEMDDPRGYLDEAIAQQRVVTTSQRQLWYARAELALAQSDPALAWHIAAGLVRIAGLTPNTDPPVVLPRLALLRAEIVLRWPATTDAQLSEVMTELNAACDLVQTRGAWPSACRLHLALGQLYRAQHRTAAAEAEFSVVRQLIDDLAANIADEARRDYFVTQALARLPRARSISPRRVEKERYGGLTERERQVAGFVAQGKSNREIAAALFVGERTIETHVSNIMSKLGIDARTQIAAWAVSHGLAQDEA